MIFIQLREYLPQLCLLNWGHILTITISKFLPTNLPITITVNTFKFGLQLSHQLILHQIMGDIDHNCCLKLIHLTKGLYGLKFITYVEFIICKLVLKFNPRMIQRLFSRYSPLWIVCQHLLY